VDGVRLRMFAAARVAAGRGRDEFAAAEVPTIAALLDRACIRYGDDFAAVLATSRVWLNGDEPVAGLSSPLADGDEVAILPPVSGGA
jgi:molybdopterin synthase sulfur carrier subunit